MRSVSYKRKMKEGRCQGSGSDYRPFYNANEISSSGTTSLIWDPIAKRQVTTLSTVERNFFYHLRWDDEVESISEQYLLDIDSVNDAREELGYRKVPTSYSYTTDFLVDYWDGSRHAYSVKWKKELFNPDSIYYVGRPKAYERFIRRQKIEEEYWKYEGVPFSIVTGDDFDQVEAENIAFVLGFYEHESVVSQEQKLLYLIAHKFIDEPLNRGRLNPHQLLADFPYYIDEVYDHFRAEEEEYLIERCV